MIDAFRLGGFGMYPTAIAGLVLVVTALRYAARPDRATRALARSLSILVALVGVLGFTTGVIKCFISCGSASPSDIPTFVVVGTGESLCNVGLALVLLVFSRIAISFGTYRAGGSTAAELADPHVR